MQLVVCCHRVISCHLVVCGSMSSRCWGWVRPMPSDRRMPHCSAPLRSAPLRSAPLCSALLCSALLCLLCCAHKLHRRLRGCTLHVVRRARRHLCRTANPSVATVNVQEIAARNLWVNSLQALDDVIKRLSTSLNPAQAMI